MIIRNGDKSLSFTIDHYQYPKRGSQENGYDYDANWLVVAVTYSDENKTEEYKDACLLTYELEELIDRISEVASGQESLYISDFMEPYLKFVIAKANEGMLLGMEFVYDTMDGVWKRRKVSEVLKMEKANQIIDELKSMRVLFPQR